jgi:hypothetical protein
MTQCRRYIHSVHRKQQIRNVYATGRFHSLIEQIVNTELTDDGNVQGGNKWRVVVNKVLNHRAL